MQAKSNGGGNIADLITINPNKIVKDLIRIPDLIFHYKEAIADLKYKQLTIDHAVKATRARLDKEIRESAEKVTEASITRELDRNDEIKTLVLSSASLDKEIAKTYGILDALEKKHVTLLTLANLSQEACRQELDAIKREESGR